MPIASPAGLGQRDRISANVWTKTLEMIHGADMDAISVTNSICSAITFASGMPISLMCLPNEREIQ